MIFFIYHPVLASQCASRNTTTSPVAKKEIQSTIIINKK